MSNKYDVLGQSQSKDLDISTNPDDGQKVFDETTEEEHSEGTRSEQEDREERDGFEDPIAIKD